VDKAWFTERIWPHMFYMSAADLWRWKMNAARAMGNTLDETYIPHLTLAFRRESDERVKAMAAWALGRIGGPAAKQPLTAFLAKSAGSIRSEILAALEGASRRF